MMDELIGTGTERRPQDVCVLVVDDEPDIAIYLASVLEDAGIKVVTANDGERALEAIERRTPDLISLDLVMPGKSGIRLMMELRKNREWSKIPVIIVTAHARDPKVRNDLDAVLAESTIAGPSLYLEKPVTPRKYLESICRILGVPAPEIDEAEDSHTGLREQAHALLDAADAATLEEVLGRLRDRRN